MLRREFALGTAGTVVGSQAASAATPSRANQTDSSSVQTGQVYIESSFDPIEGGVRAITGYESLIVTGDNTSDPYNGYAYSKDGVVDQRWTVGLSEHVENSAIKAVTKKDDQLVYALSESDGDSNYHLVRWGDDGWKATQYPYDFWGLTTGEDYLWAKPGDGNIVRINDWTVDKSISVGQGSGLSYHDGSFYLVAPREIKVIDKSGNVTARYDAPEVPSLAGLDHIDGEMWMAGPSIAKLGINTAPTVDIEMSPSNPSVGETVSFSARVEDPDENVETIERSLGPDISATGRTVEQRFSQRGTVDVSVTVTDSGGATASDSVQLNVGQTTETPSEGAADTPAGGGATDEPQGESTDGSGPGFGIASTLGAIGGAAYLRRRRGMRGME